MSLQDEIMSFIPSRKPGLTGKEIARLIRNKKNQVAQLKETSAHDVNSALSGIVKQHLAFDYMDEGNQRRWTKPIPQEDKFVVAPLPPPRAEDEDVVVFKPMLQLKLEPAVVQEQHPSQEIKLQDGQCVFLLCDPGGIIHLMRKIDQYMASSELVIQMKHKLLVCLFLDRRTPYDKHDMSINKWNIVWSCRRKSGIKNGADTALVWCTKSICDQSKARGVSSFFGILSPDNGFLEIEHLIQEAGHHVEMMDLHDPLKTIHWLESVLVKSKKT